MATQTLDSVRLLEAEFAEAMTRMYAVGNGLAALRLDLQSADGPAQAVVVAAQGAAATRPVPPAFAEGHGPRMGGAPDRGTAASSEPQLAQQNVVAQPTVPDAPLATEQPPTASWWQREGVIVRLLGVAGAGVLLIGVVLLLAYAIQRGYLGPAGRVGGAAALAVGLLIAARRVHQDPQRATGALAIASAGYATAYLDVVAVTRIYEWLPAPIGLALAGAIAAGGVILARAWDSQFLALVTVGGVAALAPSVAGPTDLLTAGFLVVLAVAAYPAHIGRTWPALHALRVAPAVLALLAVSLDGGDPDLVLGLAAVLAGFELGTALLAAHGRTSTRAPMLLSPVLALSAIPVLVASVDAAPATWLINAAAAVLYLLAALAVRDQPGVPLLRVAPWAGATGTAFALAAVTLDTRADWRLVAVCGLALAYAATAHALGSRASRWHDGAALALTGLAVLAVLPVSMDLIHSRQAIGRVFLPEALALAVVTATVLLMIGRVRQFGASLTAGSVRLLGWLGGSVGLLTTGSAIVAVAVVLGRRAGMPQSGFVAGQALVTLLLAGVAAYLLMHGLRRPTHAVTALRAGLACAGMAVAKLLLYDLQALDGIVRIAAFIGAGLALLAMGTGYAKALERAGRTQATRTP